MMAYRGAGVPGRVSGPARGSAELAASQRRSASASGRVNTRAARPPSVSRPLLAWFTWYSRRYLRRHFHSLRVSRAGRPPATNLPLVVYSNHASWWDPLVGLVLRAAFFPDRKVFAPIEAEALARYGLLRRLGFFGVERGTRRGAMEFLRISQAVLRRQENILALTPQGRFADIRERPVRFKAGLSQLAARLQNVAFVPMAAEYVFWEERLPEILIYFGETVVVREKHPSAFSPEYWNALFEQKLSEAQNALNVESQRRNPDDFQTALLGGAGQGGFYDWWRWGLARLRGKNFTRKHGTK